MTKLKIGYTGIQYLTWLILVLVFAGCLTSKSNKGEQILFDATGNIDTSLVKAGADVSIGADEKGIRMECSGENPVPGVTIKQGAAKWELLKYKFVAADITNPGKEDLLVECRPQEMGWVGSGQIIPAGTTRTVRAFLLRAEGEYPSYLDKYLYGMDALPGGIVKSFWWSNVAVDSINRLSIVLIHPPKNTLVYINNIRAEGAINPPTEAELKDNYFPLLDEFGQLRKGEWKGKIHSLEELVASKETERKDLMANPGPDDWNKYGGWNKGPQLEATGSFRTQKIDGKWWMVDPEGRLFWSHGINSVSMGNSTPVTGREHYFTNLPDSVQYKDFYSTVPASRKIPKGYYKGKGMELKLFRTYAWNLSRKYGAGWESEYQQLAHERLRSWGMNSIGNFSSPLITGMSRTPYPGSLSSGGAKRIEGSVGSWGKFPDPFDPGFADAVRSSIKRNEKAVADPYCIGFFVDNELSWGEDSYLATAVIQSPEDQPSKIKMRDYLKDKYQSVENLNTAWKTNFNNWDDFLSAKNVPEGGIEDFRLFSTIMAEQYFKTVKEVVTVSAPKKLYLGCRFDFHYYPDEDTSGNWIVKIAGKYCDVVSFNRYRYSGGDLRPADLDKPVMIGEWHVGSLDRGMLHFSLRYSENEENRAEMYAYYLKSCLNNPYVIGAHWFEYYDQPVLGRTDGEDLNSGFLDNCDAPYPEMVNIARTIGKSMYEIRSGK